MTKLEKQMKLNNTNSHKLNVNNNIPRLAIYGLNDHTKKWSNLPLKTAINLCLALNCKLSDLVENDAELLIKVKQYENTLK